MIIVPTGKMRHLVQLELPPNPLDKNEFGEPIGQHAAFRERWAAVESLAGRELVEAQQVRPEVTHAVVMWWEPGYEAQMRLTYQGKVLNVTAVIDPDGRAEQVKLFCTEEA